LTIYLFRTFTSSMNLLTISMMLVSVFLLSFGETSKQWFYSIWFSHRFLFPVVTVIIFLCIIIGFNLEKMIMTWDVCLMCGVSASIRDNLRWVGLNLWSLLPPTFVCFLYGTVILFKGFNAYGRDDHHENRLGRVM